MVALHTQALGVNQSSNEKKNMYLKSILVAAVLGLSSITSVSAATLDFDYSFSNGTDTVVGKIFGLTDNATSSASSVTVTSSPYGAVVFDASDISSNSFFVSGGVITSVNLSTLAINRPGTTDTIGLLLTFSTQSLSINANPVPQSSVHTNWALVTSQVSPVPLPASLPLLLAALGAVDFAARRRKAA